MRFHEIQTALYEKKVRGRPFNHLEDLVFFYGTEGVYEALEHLKEFATEAGHKSIIMKWDGTPTIYWGREEAGGPLILAGHNGWGRRVTTDSPEKLYDFIANQSGSPKTAEDKKNREAFASDFASWYPMFDAATPKDFKGFLFADGLFTERPQLDDSGFYNFCPNPLSKTCYHVKANSELGHRISKAQIMVAAHAYFSEFGQEEREQQPRSNYNEFNQTDDVIILGPMFNENAVEINLDEINQAEKFAKTHAKDIDGFLASVAGLGDLKEIVYRYVNQSAKNKQLDDLSRAHFYEWLENSPVSDNKKIKIEELDAQHNNAIEQVLTLVKLVQETKDHVIAQIDGARGDVTATNGEGHVRYAPDNKKLGNVKLVPRKQWTPN